MHRLATSQAAPTPPAGPTAADMAKRGIYRKGPATDFLKKLQGANGKELDATTMAKYLGINSPNGVGPRLGAIKKDLEAQSPPVLLDDYLPKRKGPNGTIWTVNFDALMKPE